MPAQIPTLQPLPDPSQLPPEPATCNLQPATGSRRPKGKIPSLPKAHRETINRLLLDGATYKTVEIEMAKLGISLNAENVSNWYQTGFQDFLAQLDRLDYQRARYEAATDLLQHADTAKLPEASLQSAAAQIYDLLGRFTPAALASTIADDPDKYTRLLNSLSRLTREALAFQKYRDACARARAALEPMKDPKRKLSESETRAIVRHVDNILGLSNEDEEETGAVESPMSKVQSQTSEVQSPQLASGQITGGEARATPTESEWSNHEAYEPHETQEPIKPPTH